MKKKRNRILLKGEIVATICIIAVIIALTIILFFKIYSMEEEACWNRLEENANEISNSIVDCIEDDRQLLTVLADVIAGHNSIYSDEIKNYIESFTPHTISSYIAMLLPDNSVILPGGIVENSGISFEEEVILGVHTSNRVTSVTDGNHFVIRNFIPIEKDGEVIAMLFGVIDLETLPDLISFSNYDKKGVVYLFDGNTGDDLINTWHKTLGNAYERGSRPVKQGYNYEKMQTESLAGGTGHIIFVSESIGEYLYYYYRPVDINNWTMALSVQESIVFEQSLNVKKILITFVVIETMAFLCYLTWMLWHVKRSTQKEREQNMLLAIALERAEKAGKAKSTFLSNMSHDIRTPMNAIIGFSAIAAADIDKKERVQDCLNKITSSSNHLLALINDVLDMSKIESGKIQLREHECNLSDIMHNFINIIQSQVSDKALKLFIDSIDVIHEDVYMDSLRFNQLLLNIVGNAIKYTEPEGSIIIKLKEQEQMSDLEQYGNYTITIKDTGIGISKEYLPYIFEVFTREKNSTVSKIEGTGLGLSITKHIVEIMGGTIFITSELGKGTEVTINFSLRLQDVKNTAYIEQLSGLEVLIADNDPEVCESISRMLNQIGMVSDWVLSGSEAVLCARQEKYSAYIINWLMQDTSGFELTKTIRTLTGNNIPIFIITDYDYFIIECEARKAGATAFCQKPLFISNLRKMLMEFYGLSEKPVKNLSTKSMINDENMRILLVEDNELNREIAVEILKGAHFIIDTAVNGQIAVDMVKGSEPGYYDAVLMDIQMPVMDGYQAASEIRKLDNEELANIPIVAMTANAFEQDKQKAFENGMDAHIAKPIDYDTVVMTLKKLMK